MDDETPKIDTSKLDAETPPTLEDVATTPDIAPTVDPNIINAIKAQVLAEMRNDEARRDEENKIRREAERKEHDAYMAKMKASSDPWIELEGWSDTKEGVKIELEWNDAFIQSLKDSGLSGTDEDQLVQKWLITIMQDISSKISDETSEYE